MPIKMDDTEARFVTGFLQEVSMQIGTAQHIGPVLRYVHAKMSDEFTAHMSAVARANPYRFHHVYEWNEVGNPHEQLWRDILVGGGASRVATFEWLASKTIVPVEHEDAVGFVKEIHVFTWKAPVMEYNTNITISPKRGDYLVFFTGPPGPYTDEKLHVVKGQSITVMYPGGKEAHGAFTEEYVSWWSGEGSALFQTQLARTLEVDLADMPLRTTSGGFTAGSRRRTKTFTLSTLANSEVAEEEGRRIANAWLAERDAKYIDQARAREAIMYGD